MATTTGSAPVILVCTSGPDSGKRLAVTGQPAVIGRDSSCEVASDDPDVTDRHVTVSLQAGQVSFAAVTDSAVFVDGQRHETGILQPRQQLRIGRSLWQLESDTGQNLSALLENVGSRITAAAGVEKIEGFNLSEMFSEVFQKRSDAEMEDYFATGTATTTPPLAQVNTGWPKPWLFLKIFLLAALVYYGFVFAYDRFDNPLMLPGLITIGSFVIPFSLLILFFELNVPRNVPLYQLIKLLFLGGILALILSLFLFEWTRLSSWLGAMSAGIVEEAGKAAALLLVIYKPKYRWTLNGMLFGAAVGAGFAAFESAGYAYLIGGHYGSDAMLSNITTRAVLSVCGGHVLWTAIVGAALWRVRGNQPFTWAMLQDLRFWRVFGIVAILHMLWNSPLPATLNLKYLALGFAAWVLLLSHIQAGLREIRQAQSA